MASPGGDALDLLEKSLLDEADTGIEPPVSASFSQGSAFQSE